MSKELKTIANGLKKLANGLDEESKNELEQIAAAVVALAGKADDEGKDEIFARIEQLKSDLGKVDAEVAEKIAEAVQRLRNEMAAPMGGKKVQDKFTAEVREQIANAIVSAPNKAAAERAALEVCKRNDITGLTFPDVLKFAITFERKSTELFDSFERTALDKVFLTGIDESAADQIAKQWEDAPDAQKEIQELAAEGITLATKYIYKMQRLSNEAIDNAREAGALAQVEAEYARELENMVKRAAEKAAIVGDNVNTGTKKITTFQAIGQTAATTSRVTVVNPTTPNTVTLYDLAATADAVDAPIAEKVAVMDKSLIRTLSVFHYASGGDEHLISNEEIAQQIGVSRIVPVDYISEVTGLHAVILKPSAYKVRVKNEINVAFPEYRNNALYLLYEMNMGGALAELKSAAILKEA